MTRYECLLEKQDLCLSAAYRVGLDRLMASIWMKKYQEFGELLNNLSLEEASQEV